MPKAEKYYVKKKEYTNKLSKGNTHQPLTTSEKKVLKNIDSKEGKIETNDSPELEELPQPKIQTTIYQRKLNLLTKDNTLKEKSKSKNTLIMIMLSLGGFHLGYYSVIVTNILAEPITKGVFNLDKTESNQLLASIGFYFSMGSLVSCIFSGSLAKWIGGVHSLILFDGVSIFVYFLMAVENSLQLQLMMFFCGFIAGLNYVIIPYLSKEMLPRRIASLGGTGCYFFFVITTFIPALFRPIFGGYASLFQNWKLLISVGGFIALIRLVFLTCLLHGTDSPGYYLEKIKNNDKRLMKKIYQDLVCFYEKGCAKKRALFLVEHHKELQKRLGLEKKKKKGYFYVFNKEHRARFFFAIFMNLFFQLTGVSFLTFFSFQLFEEINGTGSLMTIILTGGKLLGAVLCLYIARFPRKKLLMISFVMTMACLIVVIIALESNTIWLLGISLFVYVIAVGIGFSVSGVYIAEILDPYPIGLVYCFKFLTIAGLSMLLPIVNEGGGFIVIIWIFMASCGVGAMHSFFFCRETKGKTRLQIVKEYLGK